jgi:hypothetical protein
MKMLLAFSLFSSAFASGHASSDDGVTVSTGEDQCTIANAHPLNGGFYVTGFGLKLNTETKDDPDDHLKSHEDPDDPSSYGASGLRADDTLWTKNPAEPYPDGLPKACTPNPSYGVTCEGISSDTYSILTLHTCSLMRFSYAADSGSTVYKMKDNATFQDCDFTDAVQVAETGTLPSGKKYVDYPFDYDSLNKLFYFASKSGCDEGQKVAIMPVAEYASTYDMCFTMGANDRANRIQNCDCDGRHYRIKLSEVCHVGYVDGCVSQQPDDLSCCNEKTVALGYMNYVDGGNCIPKNKKDEMMATMKEVYEKCTDEGTFNTKCDAYKAGDCPWWRSGSPYTGYTYNTEDDEIDGDETVFDPHCEPWYMIAHCTDLADGKTPGAGFTCDDCNATAALIKIKEDIDTSSCGASQHLAAFKEYAKSMSATTTAPVAGDESSAVLAAVGLLIAAGA